MWLGAIGGAAFWIGFAIGMIGIYPSVYPPGRFSEPIEIAPGTMSGSHAQFDAGMVVGGVGAAMVVLGLLSVPIAGLRLVLRAARWLLNTVRVRSSSLRP